jgi:hypothetical protein
VRDFRMSRREMDMGVGYRFPFFACSSK